MIVKKNKLYVYTWPAKKSWYLRHPLKWFGYLLYNIRSARQRVRRGYCDSDWYNFYAWFLYIVPEMLRDLADKGHTYQASGSPEEWHDKLYRIAGNLEKCQEDNLPKNEYEDAVASNNPPENINLLRLKYKGQNKKIMKDRHDLLVSTLVELAENLDDMWD